MESKNTLLKLRSVTYFRIVVPVLFFAFGVALPSPGAAATLSGDSSTYLQSREAADGSKILGGYEYLDFDVQNLGNETISFHTGGWLRYDFKDEEFGKKTNNDLQYSYLSFRSKTDNTTVNLGRIMVSEGVAAERVDGMYARTDLVAGFGISAFGGVPVETNIDTPGNNVIYGGRLTQGGDIYRIGVSALKEEKNSEDYRKEEGVDLWFQPLSKLGITGRSSYNDITKNWMEHAYSMVIGPFDKLSFNTTASWISYDDYFFRATMSAFTFGTDLLVPHEKVRTLGEEVSWGITDKLALVADYKNFAYDIQGSANYYGGKVKYGSETGGTGVAYHRMDGDSDNLKYNEYRVYGYKKIDHIDVAVDLLDVSYDVERNGVKDAYSASLAAMYDLSEAWKVGADVEYSHNPDFDRDVRTFLKVLYHFGTKGGA